MIRNTLLIDDLSEYLDYKSTSLRPGSYKVYRNFGDKFRAYIEDEGLGRMMTKHVTPAICEAYRRHILKLHRNPTTRNKEIALMKTFFYQLTKPGWDRYLMSPAANIELVLKQDSDMHEPYSEQQVADIFGKILEKRDYWLLLYIFFIHYTFARPGREVRLLKVGDIKPRTILIRSENSKTRRVKTPTITKPLEELIDYLKVKNYPLNWYVFGADGEPGPVPCGHNTYYTRHRQILKELKIVGKYTLYGWKHTGNIRAYSLGVGERDLQQQNGFSEHRTLEIYLRRLSAYTSSEIYDKFR